MEFFEASTFFKGFLQRFFNLIAVVRRWKFWFMVEKAFDELETKIEACKRLKATLKLASIELKSFRYSIKVIFWENGIWISQKCKKIVKNVKISLYVVVEWFQRDFSIKLPEFSYTNTVLQEFALRLRLKFKKSSKFLFKRQKSPPELILIRSPPRLKTPFTLHIIQLLLTSDLLQFPSQFVRYSEKSISFNLWKQNKFSLFASFLNECFIEQ